MFRNPYLETYKNAVYSDSRLEIIMAHMGQLYKALGCVMQDMEYLGGLLIAKNS